METGSAFPFKRHVRSIWISDLHLGYSGCSAEHLLKFLRQMRCEKLYLVGDIVDFWSLRKRRFWPQDHNNVVRSILGKAKHGTEVYFIPGNHDEAMRAYEGMTLGNVKVQNQLVHETIDGRRFLVMHGDQFDAAVLQSRWLGVLGARLYDTLLRANGLVNRWRARFGYDYWSLSAFLKHRVKNAVKYISKFEQAVADEARRQSVDGLICGHIHRPEIAVIDGVNYLNCGDWVESCTALLEHRDGSIELIHCADESLVLKTLPGTTQQAA